MSCRTVLVVEDSELEAEMLERGLRDAVSRSAVVHVSTTTEAEKYLFSGVTLHRNRPDLIVLDVRVPPSGGLGLLQKLRADSSTRAIPVLMMSTNWSEEDIRDFYSSGVNSYLDKPIDLHEFISTVSAAARYWLSLNLNVKQGHQL